MNTVRTDALRRFERFYAELDIALDDNDCDRVLELVEARALALDQLLKAFEGDALPDATRLQVEFAESRIRGRIVALHADLMRQLGESRRRSVASNRYAEVAR
jgi:hypothetical protein